MSLTVRKVVETLLPAVISREITAWGQAYKRHKRDMPRMALGGGKPYFKDISVAGADFKILIDPVENAGVDEVIATTGLWEKALSMQLARYVKKDMVFVDIGANIGYHSLFVAALMKVRGEGTIHAFEPIPRLCTQMRESIVANSFTTIQVHEFGISENEGTQLIYLRDENVGGSTIVPTLDKFQVKETQTITLKSLDRFLGDDSRVDIIKIDIEGYEYEALKSAAHILKTHHPIIFMEFSPAFYIQDYAEKSEELITFLEGFGYSFATLEDEPLNLRAWLMEGDHARAQIDIVCMQK